MTTSQLRLPFGLSGRQADSCDIFKRIPPEELSWRAKVILFWIVISI
jgi:hypothetical protein